MRYLNSPFLFSPDNGDGGGGSPPPAGGGNNDSSPSFERLLERHQNDARAVANLLFQENYQYRQAARQHEAEVAQLRGQVPTAGSVILTPEQATTWTAYQQLGTPEQLTAGRNELQGLQRQAVVTEAAAAHGYRPAVLGRLAGDLPLVVREVEENGQKQRRAFVTPEGGQETRLDSYAAEQWADFIPSLQQGQQASQQTPYVRQAPGGPAPTNDPVAARLEEQKKARAKGNALVRPVN